MESMHDLTEIALVAAPPETVWKDWTDATRLAEWIWPPRFETTAVVEPVQRGAWTVRSDVAEMAVLGEVLSAVPPGELRLAWRWQGEDHATDVSVSFEPAADDATRLTVHHAGFRTDEERDTHIQGWTDCLDRLVDRYR